MYSGRGPRRHPQPQLEGGPPEGFAPGNGGPPGQAPRQPGRERQFRPQPQPAGELREGFAPGNVGPPRQQPSRDRQLRRGPPMGHPAQPQVHQQRAAHAEGASAIHDAAQGASTNGIDGQAPFVKHHGFPQENGSSGMSDQRPREQGSRIQYRSGPGRGGYRSRGGPRFMSKPGGPPSGEPKEGRPEGRELGGRRGRGRGYPGRRGGHTGGPIVHQQALPVAANA